MGETNRVVERAKRRRAGGCESPATCQWQAVLSFPDMTDRDTWQKIRALPMCDFHDECRKLASEQGRAMRPREALSLHVAAWRASR